MFPHYDSDVGLLAKPLLLLPKLPPLQRLRLPKRRFVLLMILVFSPDLLVQKEEKKEEKKEDKVSKAAKVGRRLSARVGDFFKTKPKPEVAAPAKVDENPPKIEEPTPVAPLENPATETPAPASESKPEETATEAAPAAPAAAPVVAAAA